MKMTMIRIMLCCDDIDEDSNNMDVDDGSDDAM